MASYKILAPISLGEPGATVTGEQLEAAGVNIAALVASGHVESITKPAKATEKDGD